MTYGRKRLERTVPRRRSPGETTAVVRPILRYLELRPGVWAWRANAGLRVIPATEKHRRSVFRGLPPGHPDIAGVLEGGRALFLEAKIPGRKATANQLAWMERAREMGALAAVVTSVTEVARLLDEVEGKRK